MTGRRIGCTGRRDILCSVTSSPRTKSAATTPQTAPSIRKFGTWRTVNDPAVTTPSAIGNSGSAPRMLRDHAEATTEAITIGVNVLSEKSRKRISSTKKMPAIGALNTAAMPAAAPQPSSVARFSGVAPSQRPMFDPMTEPIVTIGPSAPADPPEPIVSVDAIHLRTPTRSESSDLFRWMA